VTNPLSPQPSVLGPRTIMTILAHPDDETFAFSGTLAKYAARGARIICLCATRGEGGEISDLSDATKETLGQVREAELRAAAAVIGASEVILLDYIDGTLHTVDFDVLLGKVVLAVRRYRPEVLISFGPEGVYGHLDHITMSKAALAAWHAAADPAAYPEQLADGGLTPHQADRLYYFVFGRQTIAHQMQNAAALGFKPVGWSADLINEVTLASENTNWASVAPPGAMLGSTDDHINTAIDIAGYGDKKHAAIFCHRTQLHTHEPQRYFIPAWFDQAYRLETFARVNRDGSTRHTTSPDEWASEL
jgi:LmbE family N-acetylglucosaminyl deacetylase